MPFIFTEFDSSFLDGAPHGGLQLWESPNIAWLHLLESLGPRYGVYGLSLSGLYYRRCTHPVAVLVQMEL